MAGTASTIAAIAGVKQQAVQETSFAGLWGEVADCVYRQNGWALCDPDNRALAVEAVNTLVRQVNTATSSLKSEASAPKQSGGPQTFGQVKAELDGRSARIRNINWPPRARSKTACCPACATAPMRAG